VTAAGRGSRQPSLLAVFAHPDDESLACGGLLALCAENGVRTSLLCLTRGEHGPRGENGPRGEQGPRGGGGGGRGGEAYGAGEASRRTTPGLAEVRTRELREAATILSVHDVLLLEHEDGMLPWLDPAALERDVLDAVRRLEPDVVVTFDEDGLYWHPDHIAVHERVTGAVTALGSAGPALYYVSVPPGTMRSVVESVPGSGESLLGVGDPEAFGAHAPSPTLVVEAGALAARKLAALRCHHTQVEGSALDALHPGDAARTLGREHYRRAAVGRSGTTLMERFGTTSGVGRAGRPAPGSVPARSTTPIAEG
jgi:LmbE family N-acetylglucosaminyl deacetylase